MAILGKGYVLVGLPGIVGLPRDEIIEICKVNLLVFLINRIPYGHILIDAFNRGIQSPRIFFCFVRGNNSMVHTYVPSKVHTYKYKYSYKIQPIINGKFYLTHACT